MHQIVCLLGLRPRPHWGSLQHSPRLPSWFRGWGRQETEGGKGDGKGGRGGEGKRGEGVPECPNSELASLDCKRDDYEVSNRFDLVTFHMQLARAATFFDCQKLTFWGKTAERLHGEACKKFQAGTATLSETTQLLGIQGTAKFCSLSFA